MEQDSKKIIDIKGVKLEVDLREAVRVDRLAVGTRVKVLKKNYSDYKVLHGVIVGFEPFAKLPTVIVAAALIEYNSAKMEFIYYNEQTKDVEIVASMDDDLLGLDKPTFLKALDREIAKFETEKQEVMARKAYFLKNFSQYWKSVESDVADALEGVDSIDSE